MPKLHAMKLSYSPLWLLVLLVLVAGMFFPSLMDTDAPEYAGIAMHMQQQNSWGTIINRTYENGLAYDYLDKPHVLFWSTWLGYKLFGVSDYGYRMVSILLSLVAAMATYKLGTLLYNKRVGNIAALMLMSAQAIILANHDVRTDSLLTSFVVLSVWQLVCFTQHNKWQHLIWAGAFLAAGVGTKGMIAVMVTGSVFFFYLLAKKDWSHLLSWKWLVLFLSFFLFLSPVLYLYYHQIDLHPEKIINGTKGMSGIKFLLWTQSFERFAGDRTFVDNPEFSFFFHTLLWALLPWSLLYYSAVAHQLSQLVRSKGRSFFTTEQLTFTGVWVMFLIMSKSSFKLPHYLNVLFPFYCIFIAAYLHQLFAKGNRNWLIKFRGLQWIVIGILGILFLAINGWAFPITDWKIMLAFLLVAAAAVYYFLKSKHDLLDRVWIPSAVVILLINFVLNIHFYPQIAKYQGGSAMAAEIKKDKIALQDIYLYHTVIRSFDFYVQAWRPMLSNDDIKNLKDAGKTVMLFTNDDGLKKLQQTFKQVQILKTKPDFHITGLNAAFLNPATRGKSYGQVYLLQL